MTALLQVVFAIILGFASSYMPANQKSQVADQLPQSIEAEKMILGAVVLNNDAALTVLPILRDKDFFLRQHQEIYSSMEILVGSGSPVSTVTLMDELGRRKRLEAAGGVAYLSQLADGLPRVSNVEHYARIVKEKSVLRALIHECEAIQQSAMEGGDSSAIVEGAVTSILGLAANDSGAPKIIEWRDAAKSAVREIEKAKQDPGSVFRGMCGVRDVDETTTGLRRGEMNLIVGATSHGKSLLAEQYAITSEESGYSGIIFSAEMSAESIAMRQLAYDSDVFFYHVRKADSLTEEKLESLRQASNRERRIAIVDRGVTPARVFALSEARKRTAGLDFVIVDYDQIVIEAGLDEDADNDDFFRFQARFVRQATAFAQRLDVCFILLAQQRKMPAGVKAGAKPQLDDIFGSSAMRNHPNVIMWVVRDFFLKGMKKEHENEAHIYVLKSRNGKTKAIEAYFDNKRVRFLDKKARDVFAEDDSDES